MVNVLKVNYLVMEYAPKGTLQDAYPRPDKAIHAGP